MSILILTTASSTVSFGFSYPALTLRIFEGSGPMGYFETRCDETNTRMLIIGLGVNSCNGILYVLNVFAINIFIITITL